MFKQSLKLITRIIVFICAIGASASIFAEHFNILLLSDIHLGTLHTMNLAPLAPDDDNDLDVPSFELLLGELSHLITQHNINPDMALITGDFINHNDSLLGDDGYDARNGWLKFNFSTLKTYLSPFNMPMAFAFGNNDSLGGHYKAFYSTHVPSEHSPFESALHEGWLGGFVSSNTDCHQHYICIDEQDEDIKHGYYVTHLKPNLELIVLNSVLFHISKPCGQSCQNELAWLDNKLQEAKSRHDSVILAMHIPPGTGFYQTSPFWNKEVLAHFVSSMHQYADTVIGIIAGHTHMEELHMIITDNHPIIPVIYAPALSTSHGNLPAFKLLSLQRTAHGWAMSDYQTFHYQDAHFKKLYQFQDVYCPSDKSVHSIPLCLKWQINSNRIPYILSQIKQFYTLGNDAYQATSKPSASELFLG